jgi:hypothetical protein
MLDFFFFFFCKWNSVRKLILLPLLLLETTRSVSNSSGDATIVFNPALRGIDGESTMVASPLEFETLRVVSNSNNGSRINKNVKEKKQKKKKKKV